MDYGKYKNARNASWQCIIDYNINSLPVKASQIAKKSDITIIKNSQADFLQQGKSGATVLQDEKFYIIYNDEESVSRCRFTIAHELGHIFLGHLMTNKTKYRTFAIQDDTESEANVFARDLLAPACVLHELNLLNADDIARVCNISLEAARYRSNRMQELEKRNAWYLHPLERQVYEQFKNYIENNKAD